MCETWRLGDSARGRLAHTPGRSELQMMQRTRRSGERRESTEASSVTTSPDELFVGLPLGWLLLLNIPRSFQQSPSRLVVGQASLQSFLRVLCVLRVSEAVSLFPAESPSRRVAESPSHNVSNLEKNDR